jgi:hypothetical protein
MSLDFHVLHSPLRGEKLLAKYSLPSCGAPEEELFKEMNTCERFLTLKWYKD